jgi:hypothetical protein
MCFEAPTDARDRGGSAAGEVKSMNGQVKEEST